MLLQSGEQVCVVRNHETLVFSWTAVVDPSDVISLFHQIHTHCPNPQRVFWLWDMTATQLLPRDTRRQLLEETLRMPLNGTAVITREFALRIPVTMLLEAIGVELPNRPPYRFFETREEGTVWIQALRE